MDSEEKQKDEDIARSFFKAINKRHENYEAYQQMKWDRETSLMHENTRSKKHKNTET